MSSLNCLAATAAAISSAASLLRELADLAQVHMDRVPIVLDHLNVVLPCMSRTLRDVVAAYEDTRLSRSERWRQLWEHMMDEDDGLGLLGRFALYHQFLASLRDLLTR